MEVNTKIVICGLTPRSLVDNIDLLPTSSAYTEDGGRRFLRNVGACLPIYMTSQTKQL
jgi:hypothetical protein